jgi:hypothetical protein
MGYQGLRFTSTAWRGRIFVWLRGKNQEFVAIVGEKSPHHRVVGVVARLEDSGPRILS